MESEKEPYTKGPSDLELRGLIGSWGNRGKGIAGLIHFSRNLPVGDPLRASSEEYIKRGKENREDSIDSRRFREIDHLDDNTLERVLEIYNEGQEIRKVE